MKFDQQPEVLPKVFHSTGIDMHGLRKTKDWPLILRMMRIASDITLSPGVEFIVGMRQQSAHLDVICHGLTCHFMRWNSAVAAEALKVVIEPLRQHKNDPNHGIWEVIRSRQHLIDNWNSLEKYLSADEHMDYLRRAKVVRDKLLAHYDDKLINEAFNSQLDLHAKGDDETIVGWHLQSGNDGGMLYRNNMIDQLMNVAWFQTYGIEPTANGPDQKAINDVSNSLQIFFSLVANFTHGTVIAYLEHHDLTIGEDEGEPLWIQKDREQQIGTRGEA